MSGNELERTLAKSRELIQQQDWEEALQALTEATRLDPECAGAWYETGKILKRLNRIEEALEAFHEMIELDPEDADAWYNRGVCLMKLGETQEALAAFQESKRLNPQDADAAQMNGIDFMGLFGRGEETLQTLEQITDSDTNGEGIRYYTNQKFGYQFDLIFGWEDEGEDFLDIREESPSRVIVTCHRTPQSSLTIEAKERIPCHYPAKELAADLAADLIAEGRESRFYVFPHGQVPAYAVHICHDYGDEVFCDIIVTDRFVYKLTRVLETDDYLARQFAENTPANFIPLTRA